MNRAFLLTPLFFLLAACPPAEPPRLTGTGHDMFAPVKMRLHPLTRWIVPTTSAATTAPGAATVEARLEFTDQFGDVAKGVGKVYFELYAYEPIAIGNRGERIDLWNADIATPELNKQHFDPITRTYLFKLGVNESKLPRNQTRFVIVATFTLPNESRLSDSMQIAVR